MERSRKTVVWAAIVACLAVILSGDAFADQCTSASLSQAQLNLALKAISDAPSVLQLCEPCGEGTPKLIAKERAYNKLQAGSADAAYLYVQTGDDVFTNVAALVGCPTSGVSSRISRQGSSGGRPTPPPQQPSPSPAPQPPPVMRPDASSGLAILKCFHPLSVFVSWSLGAAYVDSVGRTAQDGRIDFNNGVTGSAYNMTLVIHYRMVDGDPQFRVTPKADTSPFPASASCSLRDWQRLN
jgi:hypothetical protein